MTFSQPLGVAQRKRRPRNTAAGEQIKLARERAGLTQGELARRAGVNQSTLQRIETEQREPGFGFVALIAHTLGLSIDGLMSGAIPQINLQAEDAFEAIRADLALVAETVAASRRELADTNSRLAEVAEAVDDLKTGRGKVAPRQRGTPQR